MASQTISLNLTTGGGRQTYPQVSADTNVEVITAWSNGATASDDSVVKSRYYLRSYSTTWPDTDDIYAYFTTDIQNPGAPTIWYQGSDISSDIINNWDYNSNVSAWEIDFERAALPYQSDDYIAVLTVVFNTGETFDLTIDVTGDP